MNFISPNLFDFVKHRQLTSAFKGIKRIAKDLDINFDEAAIQSLNPQLLFNQLVYGKIDLELIQVFTLMGWEDHQWTGKDGKTAMRNWWLSALDKDQQGEPVFRHIMVLRTILADTERYPAPKDVIQTMREGLESLIKSGEWKYKTNLDLLQALITQNAKKLAEIAFKQNKSVVQLLQNAGFPTKLPTVQDAQIQWFLIWLNESQQQRKNTTLALTEMLDSLDLDNQQKFATLVLNIPHLNKPLAQLKQLIAGYPEIDHWLSICDRNNEFRQIFKIDEIQRLECWIGTGSYQSLQNLIIDITKYEEPSVLEFTERRYIFWKNYQDHFRESWLLVSQSTYDNHPDIKRFPKVKIITGFTKPIILIRIGEYYLLQMFILKGGEADIIMFNDTKNIEILLKNSKISYTQFMQLSICLIHDLNNLWQSDCAYILDTKFNIIPINNKVIYDTIGNYNIYKKKIQENDFKKIRIEKTSSWLRNAKNRWSHQQLQQAALTAKRYNLL